MSPEEKGRGRRGQRQAAEEEEEQPVSAAPVLHPEAKEETRMVVQTMILQSVWKLRLMVPDTCMSWLLPCTMWTTAQS